MKAFPTPNGIIHIEVEDVDDWRLLTRLLIDAGDTDYDIADDICGRISDMEVASDWRDFVVPDLVVKFDASLARVAASIELACKEHDGGGGGFTIDPQYSHDWYGVLNRARLALESKYHLAASRKNAGEMTSEIHAAYLRDRLYCALQSLILDHAFG